MAHSKSWNLVVLLAALSAAAACGRTDQNAAHSRPMAEAGTGSMAGTGSSGATSGGAGGGSSSSGTHGVVPMHRLRGVEYRNSIRDLTGVETPPPLDYAERPFYEAGIYDVEPWLETAARVAAELFKRSELPGVLACAAQAGSGRSCAQNVIDDFGLRAFRRPLRESERQAYLKVFDDISALGEAPRGALEQVVLAILVSPQFTFHMELSDDPQGSAPELLDSYAVAARLSFSLWSTTPDRELLDTAAKGLTDPEALRAAFARLSAHERGVALADGLKDIWLNLERISRTELDAQTFPAWNHGLRDSMAAEAEQLLRTFLTGAQPLRGLFTLDVNFVDDPLAALYGFAPVGKSQVKVVSTQDERAGLLGLAGFLVMTSSPTRSSPTRRGAYIMTNLLCSPPDPPPADLIIDLPPELPANATIRQRIEADTAKPLCQSCHQLTDPLGFALGHFDASGRYIDTEPGNATIDASGRLAAKLFPDGTTVNGLLELAHALESSPLFHACAAQNVAQYLVRREMTDETDADLLVPLTDLVTASASLPLLSEQVVLSDAFRYRRQPATL